MFDYDFRRRMEAGKNAAALARGRGENTGAHASWRTRHERPESEVEAIDRVLSYVWQELRQVVADINWRHHVNGPMWATERNDGEW